MHQLTEEKDDRMTPQNTVVQHNKRRKKERKNERTKEKWRKRVIPWVIRVAVQLILCFGRVKTSIETSFG